MKLLAIILTGVGMILAYTSEFGAFLFGMYKYTQGHRFWVCVLWGIVAEVILRTVAFSSMWIAGSLSRENR
jgi:hypothetical protein